MRRSTTSPDDHITYLGDDVRADIATLDASGEWFVIGLAAQKNYITVFVTAVDDRVYLAEAYRERLGKVKVGRSSISFKRLSDIDLPVMTEMLGRARTVMLGS